MKTYIAILFFGFVSFVGFAHQTEISSTVLAEKENRVWMLQISASLTAFQQEINTHYAETAYQTPEEFREMVIAHIQKNIMFTVNGQRLSIVNGTVYLGHETKVVFEVTGMPQNFDTVDVKNSSFSDVHHSKSLMVVLKEGIQKNKFILDKSNNYSASLEVRDGALVAVEVKEASMFSWPLLLGILGLAVAGYFANRLNLTKASKN